MKAGINTAFHAAKILLLLPFSLLYGLAMMIRNKLFDWNMLPSRNFQVPIISVGNISVGGTGKTPHIEYLIKLFANDKIAVLSRGYGRKSKGFKLVTKHDHVRTVGDEPLQISSKFPDIRVAVCERRVDGISKLLGLSPPPEKILLDDAFQHRYVKPGLSIVLINYHKLIYYDLLLPAGRLREPTKALKRADIVVVSKCPADLPMAEREQITGRLTKIAKLPVFFSYFKYGNLKSVFTDHEMTFDSDCHVLLVTGIAHPGPLKAYLDASYMSELHYPDHHNFTEYEVKSMLNKYRQITHDKKILLTTEKDAQRFKHWQHLLNEISDSFFYMPVEVDFLFNERDSFNEKVFGYFLRKSFNL